MTGRSGSGSGPEGAFGHAAPDEPAAPTDVAIGLTRAFRGAFVFAGVVVAFVLFMLWGAHRGARPSFATTGTTGAASPAPVREDVKVGTRCLHVAVAATQAEREHGLKDRPGMGGIDGMLFTFNGTVTARFTMSGVRFPITIGFYDTGGRRVDRIDMATCPGTQAQCPAYAARGSFHTALETAHGQLPDGPLLMSCS